MQIGIDETVEEIICLCMEAANIDPVVIKDTIKAIHESCSMVNFTHNYVADVNLKGYHKSEENRKIKEAEQELQKADKRHKEEMEEVQRNARWMGAKYQQEIEELRKQIK